MQYHQLVMLSINHHQMLCISNRMSSLHVLLYYVIPDMGDMPMVKVMIIEMITNVLENRGVNINDFREVSLIH